ncbi:MAG: hypothetical protein J3T61_01270 [Candidatus Brocadiales bacterium]|nr:hypothetical protein [Candidatus Bathyanammoxibius sp.]
MIGKLLQKIVDELSQLNCFLREQAILSTTQNSALHLRTIYEKWAKEAGFHRELMDVYPWNVLK